MENRAAQFAPFAALSGHDAAIAETARLTTKRPELTSEELYKLSRRLTYAIEKDALITITFFQPYALKQGGSYRQVIGRVKKIDEINGLVFLRDQQTIALDCIENIDSDAFDDLEF